MGSVDHSAILAASGSTHAVAGAGAATGVGLAVTAPVFVGVDEPFQCLKLSHGAAPGRAAQDTVVWSVDGALACAWAAWVAGGAVSDAGAAVFGSASAGLAVAWAGAGRPPVAFAVAAGPFQSPTASDSRVPKPWASFEPGHHRVCGDDSWKWACICAAVPDALIPAPVRNSGAISKRTPAMLSRRTL